MSPVPANDGAQAAAAEPRFYGKYRGTVLNNVDPMQIGRVQVTVPDVFNVPLVGWATPCFPVGGVGAGVFTAPPIGSGVWVEFEAGDPERPIWTGGFYGTAAERPPTATMTPPGMFGFTIGSSLQNSLTVTDLPGPTGGILLKSASGASIAVNDTGIYIQNGRGASITLVGPSVTVNAGALVVT